MENKTFTTPGGYLVTIKTDLTYGQYEEVQAMMSSNIKIDPTTGKPRDVDFSVLGKANEKALEYLLVSIEKDGVKFEGKIQELGSKDGRAIMAQVDAIMKTAYEDDNSEEAKKKERE